MNSPITTHVLDTARGRPAAGVGVALAVREASGAWRTLAHGTTDEDGRLGDLLPADAPLPRGLYRLTFDVGAYFEALAQPAFYAEIPILFDVRAPDEHYHVPLLLSPFGYATYRGS